MAKRCPGVGLMAEIHHGAGRDYIYCPACGKRFTGLGLSGFLTLQGGKPATNREVPFHYPQK